MQSCSRSGTGDDEHDSDENYYDSDADRPYEPPSDYPGSEGETNKNPESESVIEDVVSVHDEDGTNSVSNLGVTSRKQVRRKKRTSKKVNSTKINYMNQKRLQEVRKMLEENDEKSARS